MLSQLVLALIALAMLTLASSAFLSLFAGVLMSFSMGSIVLVLTYRRCKRIALYRQICRETIRMYYNPSALQGDWQQSHLLRKAMRSDRDVLRLAQTMLDSLQDRHTNVLSKKEVEIEASLSAQEYSGIGMAIEFKAPYPLVAKVFDGSPAQERGIHKGDLITGIDGRSTRDLPVERIRKLLTGSGGTELNLTMEREGMRKTHRLTRKVVRVRDVAFKILRDGIGYLKIFQFGGEETTVQALQALAELKHTRAIVIDLRDNPGGQLRTAMQITSLFLETGKIATIRQRLPGDPCSPIYHSMDFKLSPIAIELEGRSSSTLSSMERDTQPRLPYMVGGKQLVVLVNEASASASELMAGALKDNRAATVVGTQTYGKGTGQSVITLKGGAQLTITTMQYFTPSGLCPGDGNGCGPGIVPDILVRQNDGNGEGAEGDTQLQKALNHLSSRGAFHSLPAAIAPDVSFARILSLLKR